jgi:tetratricopeptide (TPR) repeat protein
MAVIATRSCRTILILAFAMLASLWLAAGAQAADKPGKALSSADEARYRAAFADAERGDFDAAAEDLEKVRDKSLIGHVDFVRLMHPTAYRASYDELADWLTANAELGGAERIYALAKKRQPRAARDPKAPSFLSVSTDWMTGAGPIDAGTASFQARDAYYSGRIAEAWALAPGAGEPWIAGLAGWRLGKTEEARRYFLLVAEDDANDDWLRSAAWFWAARCSERLGEAGVARDHFNRAAIRP